MRNYRSILNAVDEIRDSILALTFSASSMSSGSSAKDFAVFYDFGGASLPAVGVFWFGTDGFSGVREAAGEIKARYEVHLKVLGTNETDLAPILADVMDKLEDYRLQSNAAGVDFGDIEVMYDTSGGVRNVVGILPINVTIK